MSHGRARAAFMGSPAFAVPSLHATAAACDLVLVVSQPDRPAGRGKKLREPDVKVAARALGVPVVQPESLRDEQLLAQLGALDLDIVVVTAYGRILPSSYLTVARHGCVNVHASILPRWRGAAPIQRAILAGDAETGVSLMRLDAGCDTGPVYGTRRTPIGSTETSGQLFERLADLGADELRVFLGKFPDWPEPVPQDERFATHARKLEKDEGRVDWGRPSRQIVDHVRGMDPWPGAFTTRTLATPSPLRLFGAEVDESIPLGTASPGTVLFVDEGGLGVACGDGVVRVREVQAAGKRRMSACEYAAGQPFTPEERLGDALNRESQEPSDRR